jgi:hypothetical protein
MEPTSRGRSHEPRLGGLSEVNSTTIALGDMRRPALSAKQILAWADAHRERTGTWPKLSSGRVAGKPGETWQHIDAALRYGYRRLPGGSSLARLPAAKRSVWNPGALPRLSEGVILEWADAHFRRTGSWPSEKSGPVGGAPDEGWGGVDDALRRGRRRLPGSSSLGRLLEAERSVRGPGYRPPFTVDQILAWADAHRASTLHRALADVPVGPDYRVRRRNLPEGRVGAGQWKPGARGRASRQGGPGRDSHRDRCAAVRPLSCC